MKVFDCDVIHIMWINARVCPSIITAWEYKMCTTNTVAYVRWFNDVGSNQVACNGDKWKLFWKQRIRKVSFCFKFLCLLISKFQTAFNNMHIEINCVEIKMPHADVEMGSFETVEFWVCRMNEWFLLAVVILYDKS